mgnify:CR=1 FL=1
MTEMQKLYLLVALAPLFGAIIAGLPFGTAASVNEALESMFHVRARPAREWGDLVRAAQGVDKKLITDVSVFDVYEGKGIDPGKKSVAIEVVLQPRDKTLTDVEIEALGQKIKLETTKWAKAIQEAGMQPE